MDFDPAVAAAGLVVGFVVGLTGMGGGALTTPVLVLVFGVQPLTAVSSDLVASLFMKPFGSAVHLRRGTVNWPVVRWLTAGSVPAAFAGVLVIRSAGGGARMQHLVTVALGGALVLAAAAMLARVLLDSARGDAPADPAGAAVEPVRVRAVPTMLVGVLGGLLVGMTSTGSGTVIIVCLTMVYRRLPLRSLVGTDLVQAVPLVGAAALGHLLFGDVHIGLTAALLAGSIPGVLLGARLSAHAPDLLIRPTMVLVLTGTALKLLGAPTPRIGLVLLAIAAVGLPLWAVFDAACHPRHAWNGSGMHRGATLVAGLLSIPLALGPVAAVLYFARLRPRLRGVPRRARSDTGAEPDHVAESTREAIDLRAGRVTGARGDDPGTHRYRVRAHHNDRGVRPGRPRGGRPAA